MAFLGNVKPERWNHFLNPVNDMTCIAISKYIGEGVFDYEATWRTYSNIIRSFIGCLVQGKVIWGDIVRLCNDVFSPVGERD